MMGEDGKTIKYCQAWVGDKYGTTVVHVFGELVDEIKEGRLLTFWNVRFCLSSTNGAK